MRICNLNRWPKILRPEWEVQRIRVMANGQLPRKILINQRAKYPQYLIRERGKPFIERTLTMTELPGRHLDVPRQDEAVALKATNAGTLLQWSTEKLESSASGSWQYIRCYY